MVIWREHQGARAVILTLIIVIAQHTSRILVTCVLVMSICPVEFAIQLQVPHTAQQCLVVQLRKEVTVGFLFTVHTVIQDNWAWQLTKRVVVICFCLQQACL